MPLTPQFTTNSVEPLYERFRKQGPPTFEGSNDPLAAEEWLRNIERILDFMKLSDQERIMCATYKLTKDARYWWEVTGQTKDLETLSWTEFVQMFNRKYFNPTMLLSKEAEFNNIQQGNMTVDEVVLRFDRLARLCSHLVPTDKERTRRLIAMLRPEIANTVTSGATGPESSAECIERAQRSEFNLMKATIANTSGTMTRPAVITPNNFQQQYSKPNNWRSGEKKRSRTPFLSSLKAGKLLKQGCMGYLVNMLDTTMKLTTQPEDVPIVKEFLDVFPEDLPGIPPDREIEFKIDLLPGTAPISKANKVADALSRQGAVRLMTIQVLSSPLQRELIKAEIELVVGQISTLTLQPTIQSDVKEGQDYDPESEKIRKWALEGEDNGFSTTKEGLVMYKGRLSLYGRKCRSPVHWHESGEHKLMELDFVSVTNDALEKIQMRMKEAQSRQKSYADKRRRPLEFNKGDHSQKCSAKSWNNLPNKTRDLKQDKGWNSHGVSFRLVMVSKF
ncbi:hypothetical protein UlMin_037587 [Ulmus minor]